MPLAASDCMDEAANVYLNDSSRTRWSYSILLPYLRSAYRELQAALEENDLPPLYEISAILTVNAGAVELASPPADMTLPISLEERGVGETNFTDMTEMTWEPEASQQTKLNNWVFREGKIQFLGALSNRQVKIRYIRSLGTITGENTVLEIPNALGFLAARTAGLASSFGGMATERGLQANARGDAFLTAIISGLTKRLQSRPVRRRRYPFRRLGHGSGRS